MNRLIATCLTFLFAFSAFAQKVDRTFDYKRMTQEELNFSLIKVNKKIKTGQRMALYGSASILIGGILYADGSSKTNVGWEGFGESIIGTGMLVGGIISAGIGFPAWKRNYYRKKAVEIELVRFTPQGTASVNGIGFKLSF
jgi:hypothetical protein